MVCELIEENNCEVKEKFGQYSSLSSVETTPAQFSAPNVKSVFGDIYISDSRNVIIGDKTYFNGPVTVNQIVLSESKSSIITAEDCIWSKVTWTLLVIIVFILTIVTLFFFLFQPLKLLNVGNFSTNLRSDYVFNTTENGLQIVSRFQWIAQPPKEQLLPRITPANTVIIGHTGEKGCSTSSQCIIKVRFLQSTFIDDLHFPDIRHNFLIGGDGRAYVGLGWNISGYHTVAQKNGSVDITFIGNFADFSPEEKQLNAALLLIEDGVEQGQIAKDYEIFAQCQLSNVTSPGKYLYSNLITWPNFNNSVKCVF